MVPSGDYECINSFDIRIVTPTRIILIPPLIVKFLYSCFTCFTSVCE